MQAIMTNVVHLLKSRASVYISITARKNQLSIVYGSGLPGLVVPSTAAASHHTVQALRMRVQVVAALWPARS